MGLHIATPLWMLRDTSEPYGSLHPAPRFRPGRLFGQSHRTVWLRKRVWCILMQMKHHLFFVKYRHILGTWKRGSISAYTSSWLRDGGIEQKAGVIRTWVPVRKVRERPLSSSYISEIKELLM